MLHDLQTLLDRRADLETVIGRSVWASVNVHGLFILQSELQSRLVKFGQNLVHFTGITGSELQLIGSSTGLDYRGARFLVCTEHQVDNVPAPKVGIIVPIENSYVSSAGFARYEAPIRPVETDATDLCAFDFTPQTTAKPELARRFFRLGPSDVLSAGDDVLAYLACGCPFSDQQYNIVDQNHIATAIRILTCEPQNQPSDAALGLCKMMSPMDFDPNGLSGGPVFAIVLYGLELVLKFAGIINRAGNGLVHFIRARAVLNLLDLSIDSPS